MNIWQDSNNQSTDGEKVFKVISEEKLSASEIIERFTQVLSEEELNTLRSYSPEYETSNKGSEKSSD